MKRPERLLSAGATVAAAICFTMGGLAVNNARHNDNEAVEAGTAALNHREIAGQVVVGDNRLKYQLRAEFEQDRADDHETRRDTDLWYAGGSGLAGLISTGIAIGAARIRRRQQ